MSFYRAVLVIACLLPSSICVQERLTEKSIDLLGNPTNKSIDDFNNADAYIPRHLAGYFSLNRTYAAEMFYFFFERRNSSDGPLILWMTGGPGCSSELAVFYENGPFQINDDLTLRANPYGWDKAGSIIYVDQPVNTGFSYSDDERDRVYNEAVVTADMIDFFNAFLQAHPEFKGRELYITGESYAGHYVPAVSYGLFLHSQKYKDSGLNLKGLAIGNGLTDPAIQYAAYGAFAAKNGLISKSLEEGMASVYPLCKFLINFCDSGGLDVVCRSALQFCQISQFSPILAVAGNINVYDIRKPCIGQLCYDFSTLDKYLKQPKVREELGVGERQWTECNMDVNYDMQGDWMKNYDNLVARLLESSDVHVMIYAGVEDLICNWLGNERWLDLLPWTNKTAFQSAHEKSWLVNGEEAGTIRAVDKLSFVKVFNAGHMSPMDQPQNTLDMISRFVQNKPFQTGSKVHLDRELEAAMVFGRISKQSRAFRV